MKHGVDMKKPWALAALLVITVSSGIAAAAPGDRSGTAQRPEFAAPDREIERPRVDDTRVTGKPIVHQPLQQARERFETRREEMRGTMPGGRGR